MSHIVKNHKERTNTNLRPTTKEKAKKDIKCLEDQFSAAEIYLKNKSRSCTFFALDAIHSRSSTNAVILDGHSGITTLATTSPWEGAKGFAA